MPVKPASVIGVSRTLSGPYLSSKPLEICDRAPMNTINMVRLQISIFSYQCIKGINLQNFNTPCMHLDTLQPTTKLTRIIRDPFNRIKKTISLNLFQVIPLLPSGRQKDQQTSLHPVQSSMHHGQSSEHVK